MNIQSFTENLYLKDGIYFGLENKEISYPKEGNQDCFQVEQDSFWFKHRNNCIIEAVKKYSPDDVFFDVGGGNGFVAKGLEENDIQTVLVEPGISGVLNAKKRGLTNVICSTLEDARFKPASIPAVGLFDVVEHIEDDSLFLKSINSYLVDAGLVYITVPAFRFLWSKDDDDAGHFKRYTLGKIKKLLNEVGFEIEYSTYIFSILPIPVFMFRTIPSLLGLNKNTNDLEKHKKEHASKKGFVDKLLGKVWARELESVKNGKKIPIGGSCFIVARKKTPTI